MLSLHPDAVVDVANRLHQERLAQVAERRRADQAERPGRVRHSAGHALVRAGSWLLGPDHA